MTDPRPVSPEAAPPRATTPEPWRGAWNDWIAPFHACPRCARSLNWLRSAFRPGLSIVAHCCGVTFTALLTPTETKLTNELRGLENSSAMYLWLFNWPAYCNYMEAFP